MAVRIPLASSDHDDSLGWLNHDSWFAANARVPYMLVDSMVPSSNTSTMEFDVKKETLLQEG